MAKFGIFYGSTSGVTGKVAEMIGELLEDSEVVNIEDSDLDEMLEFDNIILGSSTWGQGDIQNDWMDIFLELDDVELDGKKFALFGSGDGKTHGEHFVSALGKFYDKILERGGSVVGSTKTEGYIYEFSLAEKNKGEFVGLAIDDINQEDLTQDRVKNWVESIKKEF